MMYVLICRDNPQGGLERRMATRPEHLEYLASLADKVRVGGAFLSDDEKEPRGSILIIEAASMDEAKAIADADPYAKAGVFSNVEILPWRQGAGPSNWDRTPSFAEGSAVVAHLSGDAEAVPA